MDVTRRCDYACRILRAAYQSGENYISVSDIAENENIPYAFARSIQHDLVKGGLVKTVRGAHGGLALNCDPTGITLLQILEAVQGPVSVAMCATDPEYCGNQPQCAYHPVWLGADKLLNDYFAAFTLADLLDQGRLHPAIIRVLGEDVPDDSHCDMLKGSTAKGAEKKARAATGKAPGKDKAGQGAAQVAASFSTAKPAPKKNAVKGGAVSGGKKAAGRA